MITMHAFAAVALLALVVAVVALRAWTGADLGGHVDLGAVWFTAVGAWMALVLSLGGAEPRDDAAGEPAESRV